MPPKNPKISQKQKAKESKKKHANPTDKIIDRELTNILADRELATEIFFL
jgi:hypothetical protein